MLLTGTASIYTRRQKSRRQIVDLNRCLNLLPDMPILGSSNSAANKDMMSKIWTNGDTVI